MNIEHKDISQFIPYGEMLRGYANQNLISKSEIHRILKERGIFTLSQEKTYTVPILQTLLLSPKEFEEIRLSFSEKEDNEKTISRALNWVSGNSIFIPDIMITDINDYIKKQLPTCELERPIRFIKQNGNDNNLIAEFTIIRKDINKSWYEQTNKFFGKVELLNENGKGLVRLTYTALETRDIGEQIAKIQIEKYKEQGLIAKDVRPQKILCSDFTNENRFAFFYRLTTNLDTNNFSCENIKDVSIKPEESIALPEEIQWMDNIKRILLSGDSLDKKFFMREPKYHASIILWSVEAVFSYIYKNEKGHITLNLGFPDYSSKGDNAEFEINISQFSTNKKLDMNSKKKLKSQLLSEIDRQKTIVYNKFLEDMKGK